MGANHQSRPLRSTDSAKNINPIGLQSISVSDNGVVRIRKGTVYMTDENDILQAVLVKDEYGNYVEMVRSSDKEDVITEVYSNNKAISDRPPIYPKSAEIRDIEERIELALE